LRDFRNEARDEIFSALNARCEKSVTERSRVDEESRTYQTGEGTVPDERVQESVKQGICGHETLDAEILRRRKSNREHMRRRRANPAHRARELQKRKSKPAGASGGDAALSSSVVQPIGRVCAICHLRAAVEDITRLEPSNFTRGGFVQVRLPYCGRC
jgi:hypothetical protein